MTIGEMNVIADFLDESADVGYDQLDRWSYLNKKMLDTGIKAIIKSKDCDCSSACGGIARLGGYPVDLSGTFYTGNFASKMKGSGYFKAVAVNGWSSTKLYGYLKAGDFLLGPGHVVYVRQGGANGKWWSAEYNERGGSTGGKDGGAGDRVGYRKPYMRSRGWTYILRPYPSTKYRGEILAKYEKAESYSSSLTKLINTSPFDGRLWKGFMARWTTRDKGMTLVYSADNLADVPDSNHAFVVLGSGLKADGSMTVKNRARVELAIAGLQRFPNSKVVLTGGKSQSGVTEAEAMKRMMVVQGISEDRIIMETNATSTIGNALNSVPLLLKNAITRATIVSQASHVRRATIEFDAALLKKQTADNKKYVLSFGDPIADDDYTPSGKPIAPEKPVSQTTRSTVVKEVAYLLGLTAQYEAAK